MEKVWHIRPVISPLNMSSWSYLRFKTTHQSLWFQTLPLEQLEPQMANGSIRSTCWWGWGTKLKHKLRRRSKSMQRRFHLHIGTQSRTRTWTIMSSTISCCKICNTWNLSCITISRCLTRGRGRMKGRLSKANTYGCSNSWSQKIPKVSINWSKTSQVSNLPSSRSCWQKTISHNPFRLAM